MSAELVVVKGRNRGDFVKIAGAPVTIGRGKAAQLVLADDSKVSNVHARVTPMEGDRFILEDLASTNGTFVNDERIEQVPLRSGDLVKIGRSLIIFRADDSSAVHLADVELAGGGSSADIRSDPDVRAASTPAPAYQSPPPPRSGTDRLGGKPDPRLDDDPATEAAPGGTIRMPPSEVAALKTPARGQAVDRGPPAGGGPARGSGVGPALPASPPAPGVGGGLAVHLEELLLAAAAPDISQAMDRVAASLLEGAAAARAMVFLRHPLTGGLGRAASRARAGASADAPVQAEVLSRGALGDVVATDLGAVAPVRVHGALAGVIYVDGVAASDRVADTTARIRALSAAGLVVGLLVGADRSRRLADAAAEIVAMAGERIQRRPVDLAAQLAGTERVYERSARARGLRWEVLTPAIPAFGLADPILLGRGLDRLVEHVLSVARGDVRLESRPGAGTAVGGGPSIRVSRPLVEPADQVARLVDAEGVAADLRRARETLGDGGLAVARVAVLRAGARLSVGVEDGRVVYALELEPAQPGRGSV